MSTRARSLSPTTLLAIAAVAVGLTACLYLDEITEPVLTDDDTDFFLRLGACNPSSSDPVLLDGPGSGLTFECFVEGAAHVQWSLFVDGQERVVLQAAGSDAVRFRLDYDDLPQPLPTTLSIELFVEGETAESTSRWAVVVRR